MYSTETKKKSVVPRLKNKIYSTETLLVTSRYCPPPKSKMEIKGAVGVVDTAHTKL